MTQKIYILLTTLKGEGDHTQLLQTYMVEKYLKLNKYNELYAKPRHSCPSSWNYLSLCLKLKWKFKRTNKWHLNENQ